MYYRVQYKKEDLPGVDYEPLWTATVKDPRYNAKDPEALVRTREDAIAVFKAIKPTQRAHHLRLIECESDSGFDWAFGRDITDEI